MNYRAYNLADVVQQYQLTKTAQRRDIYMRLLSSLNTDTRV